MGKRGARWRTGFIPANMAAALQKAHGNRHYAAKLMGRKAGPSRSGSNIGKTTRRAPVRRAPVRRKGKRLVSRTATNRTYRATTRRRSRRR